MDKMDKILAAQEQILSQQNQILTEQKSQGVRLNNVEVTLKGVAEYDRVGLVHEVNEHSKYIQRQKLKAAKTTGIIIGASAVWTVIAEWLKAKFLK